MANLRGPFIAIQPTVTVRASLEEMAEAARELGMQYLENCRS
jgi:hypothetical protein